MESLWSDSEPQVVSLVTLVTILVPLISFWDSSHTSTDYHHRRRRSLILQSPTCIAKPPCPKPRIEILCMHLNGHERSRVIVVPWSSSCNIYLLSVIQYQYLWSWEIAMSVTWFNYHHMICYNYILVKHENIWHWYFNWWDWLSNFQNPQPKGNPCFTSTDEFFKGKSCAPLHYHDA